MKTKLTLMFILLAASVLIMANCKKAPKESPEKEEDTFDSISLTPSNLSIEHLSIARKKISWSFSENDQIEGFLIDRKQGNDAWQPEIGKLASSARDWIDTLVLPIDSLHYKYRIYSFMKDSRSVAGTISFFAKGLSDVRDLSLMKESEKRTKLIWEYDHIGEQGFKIDRRIGSGIWETGFGLVPALENSFIDTNIFNTSKDINIEYAVYPYYNNTIGIKVYAGINIALYPPSSLIIIRESNTELTLKWQDNSIAENGFRIAKLIQNGEWIEDYAQVPSDQNEFTDQHCDLVNNNYTYRVYAFNSETESAYIEASIGRPTLTTIEPSSITIYTVTSGGNICADNGYEVTKRGLCWSTNQNPTLSNNCIIEGSGIGSFNATIYGLAPATSYYIRAYATNIIGTSYGNQFQFTTSPQIIPTVATTDVSAITATSAISGGNVISQGLTPVTQRGVCWSTIPNPTINNSHTNDGADIGTFVSFVTGLNPVTTYYLRAYAINSTGIAYGSVIQFTTDETPAIVETTSITNITFSSAQGGGNVSSEGSSFVNQKGVCWSTNPSPTTSDFHTIDGMGAGSFTSQISGLSPGTTYFVRAYATNNYGTSYGEQIQFTVPIPTPNNILVGDPWRIRLAPNSIFVGPSLGNPSWWQTPIEFLDGSMVGTPNDWSCMIDDEFTFFHDGIYTYDTKGSSRNDGYFGQPNGCVTDEEIASTVNGSYFGSALGSNAHSYEFIAATSNSRALIILTNSALRAAFVGFMKGYYGGENSNPYVPANGGHPTNRYEIMDYVNDGQTETLTISVDISTDHSGTAAWTVVLVR